MILRPDGLDLRRSLRTVLVDRTAVESAAVRQERTIDAILQRLYDDRADQRRELVLLADEVGLGKTFVALGVAWSVLRQRAAGGLAAGPVLVVTPHSRALFNKWQREAEHFLKLVVPHDQGFAVEAVETPHDLVHALRTRKARLVIARMSAFTGELHQLRLARMAALHGLLRLKGLELSLEQRLALLDGWPEATRESLDLRGSTQVWDEARNTPQVGFGEDQVQRAWKRLQGVDAGLCRRVQESWQRVRAGRQQRSSFWEDLREVCRAAIGQTVPHRLPLVIVDEIHNWKNHPQSWWRFLHTLGHRMDRLLGLSATPFQLGPHELISILQLRACIDLPEERQEFLGGCVETLKQQLDRAVEAGDDLRRVWTHISPADLPDLERAWPRVRAGKTPAELPPRLRSALAAAAGVGDAHGQLAGSLRPFLLRHRRDVSHRAWWVGRDADPAATEPSACGSVLRWCPGLDVRGDAELVHYLMMRAVQEQKDGHGATSLGADLGGSYEFFREGELRRLLAHQDAAPAATPYLRLVEQAVGGGSHEHPKVAVTAERAFRAWRQGDKTLVFCFNIATVGAVRQAIQRRIDDHCEGVLSQAFQCAPDQLDHRLGNFQRRLYDHRQALFLLFQDYPLAGPKGRVSQALALRERDLKALAQRLAQTGPPATGGRFDRRRVVALAEQVLVERWQTTAGGQGWLAQVLASWQGAGSADVTPTMIASADWPAQRRRWVEGIEREAEVEPLPDEDEEQDKSRVVPAAKAINAWLTLLKGRAGRAALTPYLGPTGPESPSLLMRYHAAALATLPARLRALAVRTLRRMVRAREFLARFLLDGPDARPNPEDQAAAAGWTALIQQRYAAPPEFGEPARERFAAYLETLEKAIGLDKQIAAFENASRNRDLVTRVTGEVTDIEQRDRLFTGFNSPLVPEVLVVNEVGQEGIDLHRYCRQVIHHDLPWNPATLEQRTGRVDRIGSKAERMRGNGNAEATLDVVVPYLAGTYDEHRFRVVQGRAHLFEVTMGGDYVIDGHRPTTDAMDAARVADDEGTGGEAWAPLPESIANDLRLHLEADPSQHD